MSPINRDAWLAAAKAAETPGDSDAITTVEFTQMMGCRKTAALRRLSILVNAGKAERTTKWALDGSGIRWQRIPAYRLTGGITMSDNPRSEEETLDGADLIDESLNPADEEDLGTRPHDRSRASARHCAVPKVRGGKRGPKRQRVARRR